MKCTTQAEILDRKKITDEMFWPLSYCKSGRIGSQVIFWVLLDCFSLCVLLMVPIIAQQI